MQIYEKELLDGINYIGGVTTAECVLLSSSDTVDKLEPWVGKIVTDSLAKSVARYAPSNPNQADLHYLTCVLASIGWNKNDDVFDKSEFWTAKSTPEDKPFNYMHDETDIIGHMTGNFILDRSGNRISYDSEFETLPEDLDIAVSAVIYKSWSDIEQAVRVKDLIDEMKSGEWAVSMECLFKSFDYAIITPTGQQRIVARDEQSAFLTKHLRAYGGSGVYENCKIGRVLRDICFSAIGLVKRPANPRSLVLNNNNSLGEPVMADLAHTAATEVTNTDSVLVTELSKKSDEIAKLNLALTKANEDLSVIQTDKDKVIETLKSELTLAKEDTEKAKSDALVTQEQLKVIQNKLRAVERKSTLVDMKLDSATIDSLLEQCATMDDNAFAALTSIAKVMRPVAQTVATETETDEDIEVEVTVATVKETDGALADTGDTDVALNKVRASVSDWISKSVLKTTKNLK